MVFVLATTDPQKVLPTIRSRTQHFEFRLIGPETLHELLETVRDEAGLDLPEHAIEMAVSRGRGSARDALVGARPGRCGWDRRARHGVYRPTGRSSCNERIRRRRSLPSPARCQPGAIRSSSPESSPTTSGRVSCRWSLPSS